jgi:hypothetical protein
LANDVDAEGLPLTIVAVSQGTMGGAVTNNGTNVTYTPGLTFNGTDTFTYTIRDAEGGEDTATVTVTVGPDPDANPDFVSVVQADQNVTINVLANDVDAEGLPLTIVAVTQGSVGGTVINNGTSVTYTAPITFTGTETFTYTIRDAEGQESTTTVTVNVSTPPSTPNSAIAGNGSLDGRRRTRSRNRTTFTAYNLQNAIPSGSVVYRDPVSRRVFRSTEITAIQVNGNVGRIFGIGSFDGGFTQEGFVLTTVDQFPTYVTRGDTFSLVVGAELGGSNFETNSFFNPGGSRVTGGFDDGDGVPVETVR